MAARNYITAVERTFNAVKGFNGQRETSLAGLV